MPAARGIRADRTTEFKPWPPASAGEDSLAWVIGPSSMTELLRDYDLGQEFVVKAGVEAETCPTIGIRNKGRTHRPGSRRRREFARGDRTPPAQETALGGQRPESRVGGHREAGRLAAGPAWHPGRDPATQQAGGTRSEDGRRTIRDRRVGSGGTSRRAALNWDSRRHRRVVSSPQLPPAPGCRRGPPGFFAPQDACGDGSWTIEAHGREGHAPPSQAGPFSRPPCGSTRRAGWSRRLRSAEGEDPGVGRDRTWPRCTCSASCVAAGRPRGRCGAHRSRIGPATARPSDSGRAGGGPARPQSARASRRPRSFKRLMLGARMIRTSGGSLARHSRAWAVMRRRPRSCATPSSSGRSFAQAYNSLGNALPVNWPAGRGARRPTVKTIRLLLRVWPWPMRTWVRSCSGRGRHEEGAPLAGMHRSRGSSRAACCYWRGWQKPTNGSSGSTWRSRAGSGLSRSPPKTGRVRCWPWAEHCGKTIGRRRRRSSFGLPWRPLPNRPPPGSTWGSCSRNEASSPRRRLGSERR